MKPETRPIDIDAVTFVARNMREWDRKEIFATRWTDDADEVARDCVRVPHFAWTVHLERPICAIGAIPVHPHVWSVWMFATDEFQRVGLYVTKFVRRVMIPSLTRSGAHRAHCLSLDGHSEAHQWLHLLGAKPEARLREYGRNGEDFVFYVWSR